MKQRNFLKYFLTALVFGLLLAFNYYTDQSVNAHQFLVAAHHVPAIRSYGSSGPHDLIKFFNSYWPLIVGGLTLLGWLVSLILLGILKLVRLSKFWLANLIVLLLVYGAFMALAVELIYHEKRYAAASLAIIYLVAQPLYGAAIATLVFIGLMFVLSLIFRFWKKRKQPPISPTTPNASGGTPAISKEKKADVKIAPDKKQPAGNLAAKLSVLLALTLMSSGCGLIGPAEDLSCVASSDPGHCYQNEAVTEGNAAACDKVTLPKDMKGSLSNPPKDKCYLMVADNTDDPKTCDNIKGGFFSYSPEECLQQTAISNADPAACQQLTGDNKTKCLEQVAPLITPDKVLQLDGQIQDLQNQLKNGSDPDLEQQLKDLQAKRDGLIAAMSKDNKDQYNVQSDPINKQAVDEFNKGGIDSATKDKLVALNEKLKASGTALTQDQYNTLRDYYKFINDPANNIETMDDSKIVKESLSEKVGDLTNKLKFWKGGDTPEQQQQDEQLRFYQKMLERQTEIDKNQSVWDKVVQGVKDKVEEKVKDKINESTEQIAATLFTEEANKAANVTSAVLSEALDTVKDEAQAAEFRGLVKAYDNGMQEELANHKGNVDEAHAAVVAKMTQDPYAYAQGNSFAKYGNLVENPACDGSNPHCINKDVFWKAMKKSYNYQHPGI